MNVLGATRDPLLENVHDKYFKNFIAICKFVNLLIMKKMSESQTKAGNQRKFENLKNFENLKKFKNLKKFENLKFKIAQVDPRDMLNNFCFHV